MTSTSTSSTTTEGVHDTGDADSTGPSSGGESTGTTPSPEPEFTPCESMPFCEHDPEHCTPEAQVNAAVSGDTPLGPFAATFAAASLADVYGGPIELFLLPTFSAGDLCGAPAQLILHINEQCWGSTGQDVWAELTIGDQTVTTHTKLKNYECTWWSFICESCMGSLAFDLDISGDGWSLAGSVAAGCCRSYHDNHSL